MLMLALYFQLGIFCAPNLITTLAHATPNPNTLLATRAVTNTTKAGLAWPNGNHVDIDQFTSTGKVSWYYTWSVFPAEATLEFVPMFWGDKAIDQWTSMVPKTLANSKPSTTAILGMNEPEQNGQSNLTAQEGVDLWRTYVEPLHSMGYRLGSPATSSAPSGKVWLQDFLTTCGTNCTVDFIPLHWYGTNASSFITYVEDFYQTFQKPIWVTEWACMNFVDLSKQCSIDETAAFLNATQSFLDKAEFVERYSWFGDMKGANVVNPNIATIDDNGKINALGEQYIGSTGPQVNGDPVSALNRGFSFSSSSALLLLLVSLGYILMNST